MIPREIRRLPDSIPLQDLGIWVTRSHIAQPIASLIALKHPGFRLGTYLLCYLRSRHPRPESDPLNPSL